MFTLTATEQSTNAAHADRHIVLHADLVAVKKEARCKVLCFREAEASRQRVSVYFACC